MHGSEGAWRGNAPGLPGRGGTLGPRGSAARLAAEVARLFELHGGRYGSPRITADLKAAGWHVSENTVGRASSNATSINVAPPPGYPRQPGKLGSTVKVAGPQDR